MGTVCNGWPPSVLRVAQLLTTEVVTNAVVHGTGDVAFRAVQTGNTLRVEVGDTSAALPAQVPVDGASRQGGRGLAILSALAEKWGVEPCEGGKTVWFELRRPAG